MGADGGEVTTSRRVAGRTNRIDSYREPALGWWRAPIRESASTWSAFLADLTSFLPQVSCAAGWRSASCAAGWRSASCAAGWRSASCAAGGPRRLARRGGARRAAVWSMDAEATLSAPLCRDHGVVHQPVPRIAPRAFCEQRLTALPCASATLEVPSPPGVFSPHPPDPPRRSTWHRWRPQKRASAALRGPAIARR